MTTYRAVVKYPLEATDNEKARALTEGLGFVACELIELGWTLDEVESALDDARFMAEDEVQAIEAAAKDAEAEKNAKRYGDQGGQQ